jgi:hypothetical protein
MSTDDSESMMEVETDELLLSKGTRLIGPLVVHSGTNLEVPSGDPNHEKKKFPTSWSPPLCAYQATLPSAPASTLFDLKKLRKRGREVFVRLTKGCVPSTNLQDCYDRIWNALTESIETRQMLEIIEVTRNRKLYLYLKGERSFKYDGATFSYAVIQCYQLVAELLGNENLKLLVTLWYQEMPTSQGATHWGFELKLVFPELYVPAGHSLTTFWMRLKMLAESKPSLKDVLWYDNRCLLVTTEPSVYELRVLGSVIKDDEKQSVIREATVTIVTPYDPPIPENEQSDVTRFKFIQSCVSTGSDKELRKQGIKPLPQEYLLPIPELQQQIAQQTQTEEKKTSILDQNIDVVKKACTNLLVGFGGKNDHYGLLRHNGTRKVEVTIFNPDEEHVCGYGKIHKDNSKAFFYFNDKTISYKCYSPECCDQPAKTFPKPSYVLELFTACDIFTEVELKTRYRRLGREVIEDFQTRYNAEAKRLGLANKQKLEGGSLWVARDFIYRFKADLNNLIRFFVGRNTAPGGSLFAFTSFSQNEFGYFRRKFHLLSDSEVKTYYTGTYITIPWIKVGGGKKATATAKKRKRDNNGGDEDAEESDDEVVVEEGDGYYYFSMEPRYHKAFSRYLHDLPSSATWGFHGTEFFPALGKDDKRHEGEEEEIARQHKPLNMFQGLQITADEAKEWWNTLSPEQREKHERAIIFLLNHQREVYCGGNKDDALHFLQWLAFTLRFPWLKQDSSPGVCGETSTGKTLFMNRIMQRIYGEQHFCFVADVQVLKATFNAHMEEILMIICEEMVSPNNHGLTSYLKSVTDTNTKKQITRKHKDTYHGTIYWNFIVLSNELHVVLMDVKERRFLIHCARDGGYVAKVCVQEGFTFKSEYYKYMSNIDPRAFAYYLYHVVDLTNFDPKQERMRTQETARQIVQSFPKINLLNAFWYYFLTNEMHLERDVRNCPLSTVECMMGQLDRDAHAAQETGTTEQYHNSIDAIRLKIAQWRTHATSPSWWRFKLSGVEDMKKVQTFLEKFVAEMEIDLAQDDIDLAADDEKKSVPTPDPLPKPLLEDLETKAVPTRPKENQKEIRSTAAQVAHTARRRRKIFQRNLTEAQDTLRVVRQHLEENSESTEELVKTVEETLLLIDAKEATNYMWYSRCDESKTQPGSATVFKDDFYQTVYLPFEAKTLSKQHGPAQHRQNGPLEFWREAESIFGRNDLGRNLGPKDRVLSICFADLRSLRNKFSENILRKPNYWDVEATQGHRVA